MDNNFDQTLRKLGEKVTKITNYKNSSFSYKQMGKKIKVKAIAIYGTPFVLSFIILYLWKPGFVIIEVEDDNEQYEIKVSFRKIFITSLIFGTILDGLIFLYLRKKEIKL
jgi:hypothetical protein